MSLPDYTSRFALRADVPELADYFGLWAIHADYMLGKISALQGYNLTAHVAAQRANRPDSGGIDGAQIGANGVAVVSIVGPMMKRPSSLSGGTSTLRVRQELRAAAANDAVSATVLLIDSPGGTVAGTGDLAGDVAAHAAKKPIVAFIEDLGASAAYWVASQASAIYANPTALVGSIGTYAVLEDLSGQAEQLGIKVHVVRAGEFKGMGVEGTPVTDEHLAEAQRIVNGLNEHFIAGVAAGRNLSRSAASKLADGRVHVARDAKGLGLIDAVQTLDETFFQLSKAKGLSPMSLGRAATLQEIKAECVGADAEFICEQMERGASIEECRRDWMTLQGLRLEQAKKDQAPKRAPLGRSGVDPLPERNGRAAAAAGGGGGGGDDFWEAVQEKVDKGMPRAAAVRKTVVEDPARHAAMLADYNATHTPRTIAR